jgi:uroporphyrinogen-III synthase
MGAFDWLVLTSANTVPVLAQRLKELGLAPAQLAAVAITAVGPATSQAVRHLLGLNVHVVPDAYQAAALAEALRPALPARVLVVQADIARPILVQHLAAAGAAVTPVSAYHTVPGSGGVNLPALLTSHAVDAITFTSSSSVHNCLRRVAAEGGDVNRLAAVCLACIGPVTAQTVQDLGFAATVVPVEHTLEGLVVALDEYFRA